MITPAPDDRSPERRVRDEQIAAEPRLPFLDLPPGAPSSPLRVLIALFVLFLGCQAQAVPDVDPQTVKDRQDAQSLRDELEVIRIEEKALMDRLVRLVEEYNAFQEDLKEGRSGKPGSP